MEREYQIAVFIGRFQPFHNEHLNVLQAALKLADKVLVIIGSYRAAPNTKNPFSYEERKEMISSILQKTEIISSTPESTVTKTTGDLDRVVFIPVRDYYYNDNLWCTEIQQKVSEHTEPGDNIALVGAYKDNSSYYLNLFPQWEFVPHQQKSFLNSTDVRHNLFHRDEKLMEYNVYHPDNVLKTLKNPWKNDIPPEIAKWLSEKYLLTNKYHDHVMEYKYVSDYKKQWEGSPFPPIFTTTDAIVICSGHVLVVKRAFNPGKGLYALPGGFIKQNERIVDGAIRELKEETGIDVQKPALKDNVVESRVFDYPGRSLRGRTITHTFCIKLRNGELPRLKSGSDAENTCWMPLADVYLNEDKFFEDHAQIIFYYLQKS